jgi:hypothetical protein
MRIAIPAVLAAHDVDMARPIRGTIHVPDIIFKEYLYQLTKYYVLTENGSRVEGSPGRRFSMRFGIIGRAWRLKESIAVGYALPVATAAEAAAVLHPPPRASPPRSRDKGAHYGLGDV